MPAFDVLTNPTSLPPMKPGEKKTIVVTATNRLTRAVTGRAVQVVEPKAFDAMVKPPAKAEQSFNQAGATQEFQFSVEVPADAKAGSFTVRIDVVDVEHQDDNFGQSPVLKVDVTVPEVKPVVKKGVPWWVWVVVGVVVIGAGIGIALALSGGGGGKMPDVVNKPFAEAEALIKATDTTITITRADTLNADTASFRPTVVIAQDPPGGTELTDSANAVRLLVQKPWSVVPTLMGLDGITAGNRVGSAGLDLRLGFQCTTVAGPQNGKVVGVTLAANAMVPQGSPIGVTVQNLQASCARIGTVIDVRIMDEFRRARRIPP